MPVQFTVLASGSGGNASLLAAHGFGLLLDAGLGPRKLGLRLHAAGASWNRVHAVLLTHTHADHCRATIFRHLLRQSVPLYCHAQHHDELCQFGPIFGMLREQGLVCGYESGKSLHLAPGFVCRPLPLRHDSTATFGFRFEIADGLFGDQPALAYAAELGTWDLDLAEALADVDLLALEFNHDVDLEQDRHWPSGAERRGGVAARFPVDVECGSHTSPVVPLFFRRRCTVSTLTPPVRGRLAIAGEWSAPRDDFPSRSPANLDEVVGTFPNATPAETAAAVAAARAAYPGWRRTSRSTPPVSMSQARPLPWDAPTMA